MNANEILKKHEDANEMHFHEVDRKWIIEAMEEYAALRQPTVSGELADFARFLSEEYSIEIHQRIIDEWNKYYSANYR